jgi:hypothetical protein
MYVACTAIDIGSDAMEVAAAEMIRKHCHRRFYAVLQ